MSIFRFLSIVVTCTVLGLALGHLADLGYLRQWERVTPTSQDVTQYLAVTEDPSSQHPVQFTKPCDRSKPEFAFSARPPAGIVDCLQRSDLYADAYGRTTYILDTAGNVWIWDYTLSAYTSLTRIIVWPAAGLIIGAIIAFLVNAS